MKLKLMSDSAIRKKYGNATRADILLPSDQTLWIPSSSLPLNWQIGGGLQYGKVHELFGYESTGKTLLAMDYARSTQKLGGVVLWDDAEQSFNPHWAKKNGLDLSRIEIYDSNDIEGFSDWSRDLALYYRSKLTNNEPILLVSDSIAALDCADNLDGDQINGKAEMGNRAKAIFKMYRFRIGMYKKYGITVLMINQVRKKVGASLWEASETTPGGDATKFFASIRIGLNASKQIKGYKNAKGEFVEDNAKGEKIGRNIYVQIHKNKLAPPKDSIKTQVYFLDTASGYTGYSRYHGLPEILEKEGVIEKRSGARYYYKEKLIAHGEEALLRDLHKKEKLRKFLIGKSGINTIAQTKQKMAAITTNLYPVNSKAGSEE